jgi:hypothetical protein
MRRFVPLLLPADEIDPDAVLRPPPAARPKRRIEKRPRHDEEN